MPQLVDLNNSLEWNLVRRETLRDDANISIPPRIYPVNASDIVIGVGINEGRPTWKWAGKMIQIVPARPSSTAIFPSLIEVQRSSLYINGYQHFRLADYAPRPYQLKIEFAKWLIDCTIELWEYDPF